VPEYLTVPPQIKLPCKDYKDFQINECVVEGSVDSNNLKQGYWKISDQKNKLLFKGNYLDDKKDGWLDVFSDDKLVCCGKYDSDKKQGFWRFLRLVNETKKFVNYRNDTLVGLAREFTSDSILISDGSYGYGLKNGYWKFYYTNGTIKEQGYYQDNYKSGWWQSYDTKGKLIEEASYSRDEISGYIKRYTSGVIFEEGKQFNGRKRGTWKFYDAQGKQNRIHAYED
jgi:antitoxin component YwqK of YwqJK toxin-antitoxin module